MLKTLKVVLALSVVLVAGCGGGTVTPPEGSGGGTQAQEWTFRPGSQTRLAIWSQQYTTTAVSIALFESGQVSITAYTDLFTGRLAATADPSSGAFSGTSDTIEFSGTATHASATINIRDKRLPGVAFQASCPPVAESAYSSARGSWTGSYKFAGSDEPIPLALTVDDAGLIEGTTKVDGSDVLIYGFVASNGVVRMSTESAAGGTVYLMIGALTEDGTTRTMSGSWSEKTFKVGAYGTWTASAAARWRHEPRAS